MKTWFTSLNGAIILSAIAYLAFLGRTFVDFQFVFSYFAATPALAALATLINTALFGGWLWGLLAAVRGSRSGLIATLIFTLLFLLGDAVGTLVAYCPSPCPTAWPLMEIANWSNLLFGLLGVMAAGLHLRSSPAQKREAQ